jgi:hypothetical protein
MESLDLNPAVLNSVRTLDHVIMEIKCQHAYPPWLEEVLINYLPQKTSKFTTSISSLLESDVTSPLK